MTVEELMKILQDGLDTHKWQPYSRITYMDSNLEGPSNITQVDFRPVLDAPDDHGSIIFPIDETTADAVDFVQAVADDSEDTVDALKIRTEYCVVLKPAE